VAFGKLVDVDLRDLGQRQAQLPRQGGAVPEHIAQFVDQFFFAISGHGTGIVADNLFQLIGDFAGFPCQAEADIGQGGFSGIGGENRGLALVFVQGVGH